MGTAVDHEKAMIVIFGIGLDLVDLAEFTRTLERTGERFIRRIYTEAEISYCRAQPQTIQSFAVRFAAKEAIMKAIGLAGRDGLSWQDFEIVTDDAGKPTVVLHRMAATTAKSLHVVLSYVSLSHSRSAAGAVAIAEVGSLEIARRTSKRAKKHPSRKAQ